MVANFHKKANREFFNNKLLFKTFGIIFLVVILVLVVADVKMYLKKKQLISQINVYQKQIEDIKKSSQNLNNEITNADNKDYLEKLGYEQFNQTKPGETEYMFIKSEKAVESAPVKKSWYDNILNWIKNKF